MWILAKLSAYVLPIFVQKYQNLNIPMILAIFHANIVNKVYKNKTILALYYLATGI